MSSPPAKPRRADAQRNHDAVLTAAKAVFAQVGADAPMEDVAREAGVGKGTLYRRFPTREHLFAAILQERVDELDAAAQRALDAPDVWRAIPGTPLDIPVGGGVHHIGYWVDDLAAEAKRLDGLGYPSYATVGTTPLLSRGPAGTLIELCDLHSDRPSLRDLFPPESEFAGEPLLDSAL